MIRVLQITGDQDGLSASLFNQRLDLVRIVLFAQIRNQDVRALARVGTRPMPLVAAGNDCLHALQPSRAFVAGLPVIGRGSFLTSIQASAASGSDTAASDSRLA